MKLFPRCIGGLVVLVSAGLVLSGVPARAADFPKPYGSNCTERENVFEFAEKPAVKLVAKDKYEIAFAAKGNCDVTVGVVDAKGVVVRHVASGVLGKNAPAPFQKNALKQKIYWNGKDDLGVYVKEPGTMKVRVMLGLKPEFDKRLGGTSGKNLPGLVWGIAIGPDGAYVFAKGDHISLRTFDHDGNYVQSLLPPPANLGIDKLKGMGYVEYEKGKRAIHARNVYQTVSCDGFMFPAGVEGGHGCPNTQPGLIGNRLFIFNTGGAIRKLDKSLIFYMYTDGSTDTDGLQGLPFGQPPFHCHTFPRAAASPDGKYLYFANAGGSRAGQGDATTKSVVLRWAADGKKPAELFVGNKKGSPGTDNNSLTTVTGIDCDDKGRVYASDLRNNRIQIFSPEGKYLKTIPVDRPMLLRVHRKTGGIYVLHSARVRGKSIDRLTKYVSFDDPKEAYHRDDMGGTSFALDSWTPKPRLWLAGTTVWHDTAGIHGTGPRIRIWEEEGNTLKKIADFDEEGKKQAGDGYFGRWSGTRGHGYPRVNGDPTREQLYVDRSMIFDLKTGTYLGLMRANAYSYEDLSFDKYGYLHIHFNPGFFTPGVGRVDPSQAKPFKDERKNQFGLSYPEVPYDYGVAAPGKYGPAWTGVLPLKDQPGAKYFQDGLGANMRGEVAVQTNIYYVPKMGEVGYSLMAEGGGNRSKAGIWGGPKCGTYEAYMKRVSEKQKLGEIVYFIARRPGVTLAGGTIWVFDRTGELRHERAVSAGGLINGTNLDEDLAVYFVAGRPRAIGDGAFLQGKGGTFGEPDNNANRSPFSGTLIKTKPNQQCILLSEHSPIAMQPLPSRPPDLRKGRSREWVTNAEWLYAG
ncbi:hypothetical protein ACFL01_04380, partial [Planctomycetota bacterium]